MGSDGICKRLPHIIRFCVLVFARLLFIVVNLALNAHAYKLRSLHVTMTNKPRLLLLLLLLLLPMTFV